MGIESAFVPDAPPVVEFGPFQLHIVDGRLLRDGVAVPLPPKVLDTLIALVQAGGRLLTKDELFATVWKDTFVEEGSLTYSISVLRRALGETAGARYIETVPKRGYRLAVPVRASSQAAAAARPTSDAAWRLTRVLVAPFRALRRDGDTDFLAFSLPEAVAGVLGDVRSVSVRWAAGGPAPQIDADVELTGTVVRVGDRLRVAAQLLERDTSTLMWSQEWLVPIADLLGVLDDLTRRITESIAAPLSQHEQQSLQRQTPATPLAFEYYLRANQLAYEANQWETAIGLYQRALADDPRFAPAWARLARCHRLVAKFARHGAIAREQFALAQQAFSRALEIDPALTLTHSLYAQLEVDLGRAPDAMARLLRLGHERGDDPHIFAGLVHALRFCGLLDESLAAHERARRLDPAIATSVSHTRWQLGDYAGAVEETFGDIGYMPGLALLSLGRDDEALATLRWREQQATDNRIRAYIRSLRALVEGDRAESLLAVDRAAADLVDAEALFYLVRTYAYWDERTRAHDGLERVTADGFLAVRALDGDAWFETIRREAWFPAVRSRTAEAVDAARDAFDRANGPRLLAG